MSLSTARCSWKFGTKYGKFWLCWFFSVFLSAFLWVFFIWSLLMFRLIATGWIQWRWRSRNIATQRRSGHFKHASICNATSIGHESLRQRDIEFESRGSANIHTRWTILNEYFVISTIKKSLLKKFCVKWFNRRRK